MTSNVSQMPPRHWHPSPADLRAIRTYCAETEGRKPGSIVIEAGIRENLERKDLDGIYSVNIARLTDDPNWEDTDLVQTLPWKHFKAEGVELTKDGRAEVDFYIYEKTFGDFHGGLLGNAQVYVQTKDGEPQIVGFSATMRPYEAFTGDRG